MGRETQIELGVKHFIFIMRTVFIVALFAVALSARTFKIVGDHFEMDGNPFNYVS